MGLLDFDLKKITENPAFMLGLNIHGANTGNYGQLGPALSGGMNQFAQQQAIMQQQALMKQKASEQKAQQEWMKQYAPNIAGAPSGVQNAYFSNMFAAPDAFDKKLRLYRTDPSAYKSMFPGQQTNINMNNGEARILSDSDINRLGLDPTIPWFWNKSGQPESVKKTNYSDAQAQAGNFAAMMENAENEILGLTQLGYKPGSINQKIGAEGGIAGNMLTDSDTQRFNQAMKAWVRAKLRKESGAVISDEEMAEEYRTYFPQPGDSDEVILQKRRARQKALEGMARMSGGAYEFKQPKKNDAPLSFEEWKKAKAEGRL